MAQEYRARGSKRQERRREPAQSGPPRYKWVFHGTPVTAPGGHVPFMVPEELAEDLARHLERLAFWTKEELAEMAGEGGLLDVATLPDRTIRHDPPPEGPLEWFNPGPWVPVSEPAPSQRVRVDPSTLTDEQARALEEERRDIEETLRQRERMKARMAESDPHVRGPE